MPVTYTIDDAAGIVRVRGTGALTNEEVLACIEQVYSDPARKPGMPTLIDYRDIQGTGLTPQGMEAAAILKKALLAHEPAWATAFVAPQDDVFWLARTYEVLRSGTAERLRVFRDPAEAEQWLATFKAIA